MNWGWLFFTFVPGSSCSSPSLPTILSQGGSGDGHSSGGLQGIPKFTGLQRMAAVPGDATGSISQEDVSGSHG